MTAEVGGVSVTLKQQTDYPRTGHIQLKLLPERPVPFSLKLRIPYWSDGSHVDVNGTTVENVLPGRYLVLKRKWSSGDTVTVDLNMSLHYWVGEKQCQETTSIYRGPILLAYRPNSNEDRPTFYAGQMECRLLDGKGSDAIVVLECQTTNGQKVVLRDFDSAGEGGHRYVSWLNVVNVSTIPFSRTNPLRSKRVE